MSMYDMPLLAGQNMSKYISIPDDLIDFLDQKAIKDEEGKRDETYSTQIKRLLKIK